MAKNLFVKNLAYSVTVDELRVIFEAYGQVGKTTIVKDKETGCSRGFGFVEMVTDADGDAALVGLNGKEIAGRPLGVEFARAQKREKKFPYQD